MANKMGLFIAGGLFGAGVALLYAPRSGEQTRELLAQRAMQVWGQAQEMGDKAAERGQEMVDEAVAQGQVFYTEATDFGKHAYADVAEYATKAANTVKPSFIEKNDELRQKIEAARERIAAQVAKNVDAAQAPVEEIVEDDAPCEGSSAVTYAVANPTPAAAAVAPAVTQAAMTNAE